MTGLSLDSEIASRMLHRVTPNPTLFKSKKLGWLNMIYVQCDKHISESELHRRTSSPVLAQTKWCRSRGFSYLASIDHELMQKQRHQHVPRNPQKMSKEEEEVKGPLKLFRFICFICFEWKGFLCSTAGRAEVRFHHGCLCLERSP